jgi:hypothetical protein
MKLIKVTPGSLKLWGSYVIQGDILSDVPEDRIEAYKGILEKHFKPYPLPEEKKEAIPTITKIPFKEDDPGTKLTFHESIIDETPEDQTDEPEEQEEIELEESNKEPEELTDSEIAAQNEERFTTADDNPGVLEGDNSTDDSTDEIVEHDFSGEEDGFDEEPETKEPDKEPEKEDPKHSTSTKKNQTPRSKKGKNRR